MDTITEMAKSKTAGPVKVNINARVDPINLAKLDQAAMARRWSRSEMVDWLIEQHVNANEATKQKGQKK